MSFGCLENSVYLRVSITNSYQTNRHHADRRYIFNQDEKNNFIIKQEFHNNTELFINGLKHSITINILFDDYHKFLDKLKELKDYLVNTEEDPTKALLLELEFPF